MRVKTGGVAAPGVEQHRTGRRSVGAGVVAALAAAGLLAAGGGSAGASPSPVTGGVPATVSMDALPTVQINGVVWAQVTVGNTVYATGKFTSSRPAGSAAGSNETPTGGLIAYDLTTGNRVMSFVHSLGGQGKALAVSPDGSTLYVGGSFTNVDGKAHNGIAAFSIATGKLIDAFNPMTNSGVTAVAATASAVYFGGAFTTVNGQPRTRLAAVTPAGALTAWAPTVDNYGVNAMTTSPSGSRVWVGGTFNSVNGATVSGLASLDPGTGASQAFGASGLNFGGDGKSGVDALSSGGSTVYGGAFNFYGSGKLEGTFALDAESGAVTWVNDCNGDTYGIVPIDDVAYTVGHAHDCSPIGGFPDTRDANGNRNSYQRALAFTTAASGYDNVRPDEYGWDWTGSQHATLLQWFPSLTTGTFTGQTQGAWSVTGNSRYVSLGGEFPSVNGVAQQGLVRFAVHTLAPNAYGPTGIGAPSVTTTPLNGGGTAAVVTVPGAYDPDDGYLTYRLVRDGNSGSPVATVTARVAGFWTTQPSVTLVDASGVGGSHTYTVTAVGSGPRSVTSPSVSVTLGTAVRPLAITASGNGASTYQPNPAYSAAIGAVTVAGDTVTVPFAASGPNDLRTPDGACLVFTAADGTTSTLAPTSTTVYAAAPTGYTGQQTFVVNQPGGYAYQYSCGGGYSSVPVASAVAPPLRWTAAGTASSTYVNDSRYSAVVSGSTLSGSTLQVSFTATGPSDLRGPQNSCLVVGGTTLAPTTVALTANNPGNYAGTLTYALSGTGTYGFRYSCGTDYSVATIGTAS